MPTQLMLPAREQKRLDKCEDRIAKGMIAAFYEVGKALAEISENELYQQYGTFAAYVDERWGMKPQYAYKLIKAAGIMDRLQCIPGDTLLPHCEKHVRHLAKVDPDHVHDVWAKVIETAPRTEDKKPVITERLVKEVVEWWLTPDDDETDDVIDVDYTAVEDVDDRDEPEFDVDVRGDRLCDWLRKELDEWPQEHLAEALHWIKQIIEKEFHA